MEKRIIGKCIEVIKESDFYDLIDLLIIILFVVRVF